MDRTSVIHVGWTGTSVIHVSWTEHPLFTEDGQSIPLHRRWPEQPKNNHVQTVTT